MALNTNVSMFSVLRKHFSAWRETTEKSGVSCKYIQLFISVMFVHLIHFLHSASASHNTYFYFCDPFLKVIGRVSHLFICPAVNWQIEKNVVQYEQKFRGRELPGFVNYRTFEEIVKEQIGHLEEPALLKLKEISGRVQCHSISSPGNGRCEVFERIACLPLRPRLLQRL